MKRLFGLGLAALVLVAAATDSAFAQLDKVFGPKGIPVSGTITAMSPEKVTIDVQGNPRDFAVNEIVRLTLGDEPAELTKSRELIQNGQLEQAFDELKNVKTDSITRDVVKQDIDYYRAYCQARLALSGNGNAATADDAMFAFVRNNRGSYHVYEATELLGNLAVAQGKFDDAAKRFSFLGKAPWPDFRLRATVNEARALSAQKKFPEALEKYNAILESGDTNPEATRQKMFASVGRAVCLAETGKGEEGVQILEKIIKDNDPKDIALFARTYNALGACHLKAQRSKEARLAYLHVDLLFSADAESHAEALFHLQKLWSEANKADRALAARNLLKERYAGSIWTKGL